MKYFTPELLEQLNSRNTDQMLAAMADWDQNESRYEKRLHSIVHALPDSAVRLVEEHCFHDAQVVTISYNDQKKLSIVLRSKDILHILTFELTGKPILREPEKVPAFASEGLLWLYEELDQHRKGALLRLLLSNGSELEIPFLNAGVDSFAIQPMAAGRAGKQRSRSEKARNTSAFDFLTPALPFSQQGVEKVTYRIGANQARGKSAPKRPPSGPPARSTAR
jgi:hypothetical protein